MIAPVSSIQSIFDSAKGNFLVTDTNSEVVYANRALESRTGFSEAEIIGQKPSRLWGGKMPRSFYKLLWHTIQDKRQIFAETLTNQKKSKETYQEEIYIVPIINQNIIKYYLAFKPNFDSPREKEKATKELQSLIAKTTQSGLFLQKILEYINRTDSQRDFFTREISSVQIIEDHLIAPTLQKYANRSVDKEMLFSAQKNAGNFAVLYEKYYGGIVHYFSRHISQTVIVEDLTQETFVRAFSHLSQFVPTNASYQTYLFRIAHNILVNHYRKVTPALWDENLLSTLKGPNYVEKLTVKLSIESALQKLSPQDKKILLLMYEEGQSVKEIASGLKKSENAVKLQLSRARKKLLPYI